MAPRAAILGCSGPVLEQDERAFLRDADPWGFILFSRNVVAPGQLCRLVGDLRDAVGREAPVLIDQEGGRVSRLRPPLSRDWPDPLEEMTPLRDPLRRERAMWLRYRLIAHDLHALGIDANCAPLVDVATAATHPFLRSRCYSDSPPEVARLGRAVAAGLLAGGVLPVVKHIPGHGRARADSHVRLPVVEADAETLAATDFLPFRALSDLPLAMTAHCVYAALDPDRPATLSPAVIAAIRGMIGFGGCLMTDDLSMGALSGPMGRRASAAIAAGCDLLLHCNADRDEMEAMLAETPRLAGEAAARAARALAARRAPEPADPAALAAELAAIRSGKDA
jgi:beta-N-acetylhexosaminidase